MPSFDLMACVTDTGYRLPRETPDCIGSHCSIFEYPARWHRGCGILPVAVSDVLIAAGRRRPIGGQYLRYAHSPEPAFPTCAMRKVDRSEGRTKRTNTPTTLCLR
jgi:hypothetical protein